MKNESPITILELAIFTPSAVGHWSGSIGGHIVAAAWVWGPLCISELADRAPLSLGPVRLDSWTHELDLDGQGWFFYDPFTMTAWVAACPPDLPRVAVPPGGDLGELWSLGSLLYQDAGGLKPSILAGRFSLDHRPRREDIDLLLHTMGSTPEELLDVGTSRAFSVACAEKKLANGWTVADDRFLETVFLDELKAELAFLRQFWTARKALNMEIEILS